MSDITWQQYHIVFYIWCISWLKNLSLPKLTTVAAFGVKQSFLFSVWIIVETDWNPLFWHLHHPFACSSRPSFNRHTLFCLHSDLFSAILLLIMQNCAEFLESRGMLQLWLQPSTAFITFSAAFWHGWVEQHAGPWAVQGTYTTWLNSWLMWNMEGREREMREKYTFSSRGLPLRLQCKAIIRPCQQGWGKGFCNSFYRFTTARSLHVAFIYPWRCRKLL